MDATNEAAGQIAEARSAAIVPGVEADHIEAAPPALNGKPVRSALASSPKRFINRETQRRPMIMPVILEI